MDTRLGRSRTGVATAWGPVGAFAGLVVTVAAMSGFVANASAAVCANEGLRTGLSTALPDCRAYEMVSPPDKNGGEVDGGPNFAMNPPEQAAGDGEAVTYGSSSAFAGVDPASAVATSQYLSRRTADGWATREIVPTQQLPEGKLALSNGGNPDFSLYQGFSENLDYGFLLAWNPQPDPAAPAGYFNPYVFASEGTGDGAYHVLSTITPPSWSPGGQLHLFGYEYEGFSSYYAGMSENGQHVFFAANDALTPNALPRQINLYEWSPGGLELVSELPNGTVDPGASFVDASRDGRRAFWLSDAAGENQLYMYEMTGLGVRSVEVSASQNPSVSTGSVAPQFEAATASGSHVYFTSPVKLTSDSTAAAGEEDLYQYDAETGVLSDITVDAHAGEAAGVRGVLGVGESEDVPYVYFAAAGVLAPGGSPGTDNLYVWRGDTDATSFIAQGEESDTAGDRIERTSRVAPDGQFLAFQSAMPLTGYDNLPASGEQCPKPFREGSTAKSRYLDTYEGRCMEVFEYDAHTGSLACASCNPAGLPPTADSLTPETRHLLENLVGWESETVQQRYLLDDGRLFFQSEDPLLPAATDGQQNIYEYEPEGVAGCASSGQGACLYLISTGTGQGNSYFADASEDGRDVFFLTDQQLVPQDGDEATDMYDAREGGGFPVAVLPPCSGEACKPALTPAPSIYGAPASATFQSTESSAPRAGDVAGKTVKAVAKRKPKKHRARRKHRQAHARRTTRRYADVSTGQLRGRSR